MNHFHHIDKTILNNELRRHAKAANPGTPIKLDLTRETLDAIYSVIKHYEGHPALEAWDNIVNLAQKYNTIIHALDAHSIPHNCKLFKFS